MFTQHSQRVQGECCSHLRFGTSEDLEIAGESVALLPDGADVDLLQSFSQRAFVVGPLVLHDWEADRCWGGDWERGDI